MFKFPPIRVDLASRPDRNEQNIYIGKIESPTRLYFKKGVAFFVFNSEPGVEELAIGTPNPGNQCNTIKKSFKEGGELNRYHITLEKKIDADQKPYFIGLVQDDTLELDLADGYLFFIFTSIPGAEQIQIVKKVKIAERTPDNSEVEVIHQNRFRRSGVIDLGEVRNSKSVNGRR